MCPSRSLGFRGKDFVNLTQEADLYNPDAANKKKLMRKIYGIEVVEV